MKTQYIENKTFKEDTKKFYRNLSMNNIEATEPPSMAEASLTGNHCGGEKAQHNERGEWIREVRRKISNMDWVPIQITEKTSFLS